MCALFNNYIKNKILLYHVVFLSARMLSHFNRVRLFVTLRSVAHQAPLSKGFSWQESWSGLPCLPPVVLLCYTK